MLAGHGQRNGQLTRDERSYRHCWNHPALIH
jgi:hypothetical protein